MPPLGYLICWLLEAISEFCLFFYIVPNLCLLVGTSWLLIAFLKDISNDLLKLYVHRKCHQYRWELNVRFCQIIQLYSDVKQLSKKILSEKKSKLRKRTRVQLLFFYSLFPNLGFLVTSMKFMNFKFRICFYRHCSMCAARFWCYKSN